MVVSLRYGHFLVKRERNRTSAMSDALQLKKSNCKNCYKCIRHCPVKSIRFADNQANIISNECVLCGQCVVVCPQHAKQIANDTPVEQVSLWSEEKEYPK